VSDEIMKFNPDKCPKCGELPREVVGVFKVRVALLWSVYGYSFGTILGAEHWKGKIQEECVLRCGGGHEWTAQIVSEEENAEIHLERIRVLLLRLVLKTRSSVPSK